MGGRGRGPFFILGIAGRRDFQSAGVWRSDVTEFACSGNVYVTRPVSKLIAK